MRYLNICILTFLSSTDLTEFSVSFDWSVHIFHSFFKTVVNKVGEKKLSHMKTKKSIICKQLFLPFRKETFKDNSILLSQTK